MVFEQDTERKRQERAMRDAGRLPPGQSLTLKWPVLHEGTVPRFDPQAWDFRITGLVERPLRLTWDEFSHLPMTAVTADMHCVTRWSRFDVRWEGVAFSEVMKL
ncbi:MAG: molybdopterin-dependent oxidoreductase, partial [Candidatus Acidiferrales bacterium]